MQMKYSGEEKNQVNYFDILLILSEIKVCIKKYCDAKAEVKIENQVGAQKKERYNYTAS